MWPESTVHQLTWGNAHGRVKGDAVSEEELGESLLDMKVQNSSLVKEGPLSVTTFHGRL